MRALMFAWSILYFTSSPAVAEVACVSPANVLARVLKDINGDAVGGSMTRDQSVAFAAHVHFPYAVETFYAVATPNVVGVFAFNEHDCAIGLDGEQAATTDDPLVILLPPEQMRQIMAKINGSAI